VRALAAPRKVDFRNASQTGARPARDEQEAIARYLQAARDHFRPEFLNRLDEIVVFHPLGQTDLRRIVEIQVAHLARRLEEKGVSLETTEAARDRLAKEGFDPVYGARPLKRTIQTRVANEIATRLLEGKLRPGDRVLVDAVADGFTFETAGGAKAGTRA